ncbi:hypothetical protein GCM10007978_19490 [Shewanella hanedai]|uniref:Uncharacterized protein n=1 Tax=Shewanella hanedai TaxID=25 RepID=A0A553JDV0_SHEHA|nr:hypothetical protein [Shewanella hanedai]TRY10621.1 hypothetical protein FN961_25020 [Shewanella hanedai]GGI81785.1 hypothetical protein GCM10007978_19490 [Shewanella hanedai]
MTRGYPTEWDKFCKIERNYGGFTHYTLKVGTVIGDVNRFSARYALAEDFNGITIKNSTVDTMLGYEALMRSLFIWSTAESYHKLLPSGSGGKYTFLNYSPVEKSNLRTSLISIGPDMIAFYTFIAGSSNLDPRHQDFVNDFLAGRDFNPTRLLSSMRHVFGHGELSANVQGVKPKSINDITTILKSVILGKIDEHFSLLVQGHPDYSNV